MKKIALIDMDGTLCDYDKAFLRDLKEISTPDELKIIENHNGSLWNMCKKYPLFEKRRHIITNQNEWWLKLEKIDKNFKILNYLYELDFNIQILTKGPYRKPFAWHEKVKWIKDNIAIPVSMNIVTSKGLFYGAVLFDDHTPYVSEWLDNRPRGLAIIPQDNSNKHYNHPNSIMYDGTDESFNGVTDRLKEVLDRYDNSNQTE